MAAGTSARGTGVLAGLRFSGEPLENLVQQLPRHREQPEACIAGSVLCLHQELLCSRQLNHAVRVRHHSPFALSIAATGTPVTGAG